MIKHEKNSKNFEDWAEHDMTGLVPHCHCLASYAFSTRIIMHFAPTHL